jgi:hypothetical protein
LTKALRRAIEWDVAERSCGPCSLCCSVLRVDEIGKLGGRPCVHVQEGGGCSIHARRPGICSAYACLWLRGSFREQDRPDLLGALLDHRNVGGEVRLEIREARAGAFERSARLQEIAAEQRESMPVRISDADDVMDPDRPFRLLLPGGVEQRVEGDRIATWRDGALVGRSRLPWLDRAARRLGIALERRRVARAQKRRAPPA